jgi:pilus assembly protein CpaB
MSVRSFLVIILAVAFGGSAAVGVNSLLRSAPSAPKPDTVDVVVAKEDVARFTMVTKDLVEARPYPKELVPAGALTSTDDVEGRLTLTPLGKDAPVLNVNLAAKGASRDMASGIAKGKRAFSIQTPNAAAGGAGFILPGDHVDVQFTARKAEDESTGGTTRTLLENVVVLAVDQETQVPDQAKLNAKELRTVTLLVTTDEAAKLGLAQSQGTLQLLLRNREDTASQPGKATLADIGLQDQKPREEHKDTPPPAPPAESPDSKAPAVIRTIRGGIAEGEIRLQPGGR